MIVYVLLKSLYYFHKKVIKKNIFSGFFKVFFLCFLGGFFWVGFLLPTLPGCWWPCCGRLWQSSWCPWRRRRAPAGWRARRSPRPAGWCPQEAGRTHPTLAALKKWHAMKIQACDIRERWCRFHVPVPFCNNLHTNPVLLIHWETVLRIRIRCFYDLGIRDSVILWISGSRLSDQNPYFWGLSNTFLG